MLLFTNLLLLASSTLAESVGPVGTPGLVPLTIGLLILFIFGWGLVQRSWQTTLFDQEEAVRQAEAARQAELAQQAELARQAELNKEALATEKIATEETPSPPEPDDLIIIEGIGPKIQSILNAAGITTFAQLAGTSVATLSKIVREDADLTIAFPDSWPEQAALAAAGRWDELDDLQDELKGGRVK